MRITRETLLKLAQDTVNQRTRINRGILSAYVAGSLLDPEPLVGGTTDVDLFIVHDSEPPMAREILKMSPEVHLDIAHHSQAMYRQPRRLRLDPWLGSTVYANPILLHDTQHWFEFTQASARSQFWQADNVMARTRPQAETARRLWVSLQTSAGEHPEKVGLFLHALESAANAIACLSASPLTERRFLLSFPERAQSAQNPGLSAGLLGLIGANGIESGEVQAWLPAWRSAYQSAGSLPETPIRLHPHRQLYYERAIEFFLSSKNPEHAVWLLIRTWTLSISCLQSSDDSFAAWLTACDRLGFGLDHLPERLAGLDIYLDTIDETLEKWAYENGASPVGIS